MAFVKIRVFEYQKNVRCNDNTKVKCTRIWV